MKVSELKRSLRPLFKNQVKGLNGFMQGGWNNVKSIEKDRTLELTAWNVDPAERFPYLKLEADVNATIKGNLPDCDIRFVVEFAESFTDTTDERLNILRGEVQS